MAARFGSKMRCGGGDGGSRSHLSGSSKIERKSPTHAELQLYEKKSLFGTLNTYAHNNHTFSKRTRKVYILQGIISLF